MGTMGAMGMADQVQQGHLALEDALYWHLQSNHYPPVNAVFIPTCIKAIEACQREECDMLITMPNGRTLTAEQVVEGLHLEAFLLEYGEEDSGG